MSKGKTGKSSDDIFRSTEGREIEHRGPGRPGKIGEPWTQVTVILTDAQVIDLDALALDIRRRSRAALNRAEIIRAVVGAVLEADLDLTEARSEADIKDLVATRLKS